MLMKSNKMLAFIVFVTIIVLSVPLYLKFTSLDIEASPGMSRQLVHGINGSPCGTAYYKCCGVEVAGKMSTFYDVWESPNLFGSYRVSVYYDDNEEAITKEKLFQWFYEPALKGFERDTDSCLQRML